MVLKQVQARLTVRGFTDLQMNRLEAFAGTSSRWGQRLICSVAATNGWKLWSADVSSAFLRGKTFRALAARSGKPIRQLQFDVPAGTVPLLRQLPGYADFDPATVTLDMLKPGFGAVDAPW
eukprot:9616311-Heterocapsa_arctica.AAC.1